MILRKLITLILFALLSFGNSDTALSQEAGKKHQKKQARKEKREKKHAAHNSKVLEKAKRKEARKKEKHDRKKHKREQRKLKKKGKGKEAEVNPPDKKIQFVYQPTTMKNRYRIDVLAPMYLDDVKNYKIPEKSQAGISFYEGLNIAADSLKKIGFNIDIYVHDVSSATESSEMLVRKRALDSSDLIIGAVLSPDIPLLADFANRKHINFVSTLSPADGGVRDNKYYTLLQPSLKTHCEWIVSDVAKKFPGMKLGLLYRTSVPADSATFKFIIDDNEDNVNFKTLLCNSLPGKENLLNFFDSTRPNVLIVSVLDFSYADSLLNEISRYFPSTHFEVYGMPSWGSIANLRKAEAFPNLSVNVTVPFYFDQSSPLVQYIAETFKKTYGGKASDFVYRGYETLFWYADLLKKYGTTFNEKYDDNTAAPFTKFDIKPRWDKSGNALYNENLHIFVSKYEGGTSKTE